MKPWGRRVVDARPLPDDIIDCSCQIREINFHVLSEDTDQSNLEVLRWECSTQSPVGNFDAKFRYARWN
jgi:hypothetical protein